jgi:hypothetical protein
MHYFFTSHISGTPPFTIAWSKDGRELPDSDYYKYVVYGDGGIALRLSQVRSQDAGEYTCVVRNDFGVASCSGLFAVQGSLSCCYFGFNIVRSQLYAYLYLIAFQCFKPDYKDASKLALQFTKTPLPVIAAKGTTACFCARVQSGRTTDIIWTINGKDARESAKCKVSKVEKYSRTIT